MKIAGLILGQGMTQIVSDGRTLKAMAKAGCFRFPVDAARQPYVDEEARPRNFAWQGNEYKIEYFSGCFYPFVVKQ